VLGGNVLWECWLGCSSVCVGYFCVYGFSHARCGVFLLTAVVCVDSKGERTLPK